MANDNAVAKGEAQLIEHLVGSVLGSIIKAQGLAASQLMDMVDAIGFEPAVDGGARKTRTFSFEYFRTEVDAATNQLVTRKVIASVPLLTMINLPSIAIQEATIDMDLQLVAHEEGGTPGPDKGPLKLYVVPAKKQLVRTAQQALAIDAAGTIKLHVIMREEPALGLEKLRSLLDTASSESAPAAPQPVAGFLDE